MPDCNLRSEGQFMTIEMVTDGFTEASGFRATHIAIDPMGNDRSWENSEFKSK